MKKYSLTKTTKEWCGITLFEIKAEMSFGNVEKGELGGYIEKESNLSQENDAWVSGDAEVFDNAMVYGDAEVYGNAEVYGDARVSGNARVYGELKLLAGYFFGVRYQKEEIKFKELDENYELIYKGDAKFGEENTKKDELLKKADELIAKAEEIKQEANNL